MAEFELRTSGNGSNQSTNCATTTALNSILCLYLQLMNRLEWYKSKGRTTKIGSILPTLIGERFKQLLLIIEAAASSIPSIGKGIM